MKPLSSRALLELRQPFEALERGVLERHLSRPGEVAPPLLDGLRYVLNFAKLTFVRDEAGRDHDVRELLAPHAWKVREELSRRLGADEDTLWAAARVLPELVADTQALRVRLREQFNLSREGIDRAVTHRKLALVLGGGGGAGYGYAGIATLLHRNQVQPELICGTSMGALIGMFRARTRQHDMARMLEANKSLTWSRVFSLKPEPSRYGLPATLRLYLRRALASFMSDADGRVLTIGEMAIPLHIVATGLTVDALKHDLGYYEHLLDDVVKPGMIFRASAVKRLGALATVFSELTQDQGALREVVFGRDPGTLQADVIDAAGFSASVPGLLHYDVHRDDQRMKHLLDQLYADYGITRLTEGGVVNNVPARVAFRSAMEGRLQGHRNTYVLAVDCFPPRPSSLALYPVQQIAAANVVRNKPYANLYLPLGRTLSPLNLVPKVEDVARASRWAMAALEPHMPLMLATLSPFAALPDAADPD
ncbi:MAG: patatin-like phospholipase family protein [Myxococcota bacterium]|nr:patatin-like phospholipase family protein [Myxococcota bacterium]